MDLVTTFTSTMNCPVLKHGLKKIPMDFFYCKDCDKEEKFPMCHSCIKKCHSGHSSSEKHQASSSNLLRCSCAMNNHQTSKQELNEELTICYFYELNKISDNLFCYENKNGHRICEYCYCFCKSNSHDEEEFKLPFTKVKCDFTNNNFVCDCPSFRNSKHTTVDFMFKCLGDVNKSTEFYFCRMSPVILLNIFFNSKELFGAINKKFIDVFETIINDNQDPTLAHANSIESISSVGSVLKIPSIISQTYSIWAKNAKNCKAERNLIFCQEIQNYFDDKIFKCFFGVFDTFNLITKSNFKSAENFYDSFLYGYRIFNIWSQLTKLSLPRLCLGEFINSNPYHRLHMMSTALNRFDVAYTVKIVKNLIRENANYSSVRILNRLFAIIKVYASFYLFNVESINDFCKTIENFFINFENIRDDPDDYEESKMMIKLFKKISKILIYFSYYFNDMALINNVSSVFENKNINVTKKEKSNFVYKDSEIPRNIAKNVVHVAKYIESEFVKIPAEEKEKYSTLVNLVQIMVNISFAKSDDVYLTGVKRIINPFSEEICKYLIKESLSSVLSGNNQIEINSDFNKNVTMLATENSKLTTKVIEYYTNFETMRNSSSLMKTFENSLDMVISSFSSRSSSNIREVLSKNATENAVKNSEDVNEMKNLLKNESENQDQRFRLLTPLKDKSYHFHSKTNIHQDNNIEHVDSIEKINETDHEHVHSISNKNSFTHFIPCDNVHVIDLSYYAFTISKIFCVSTGTFFSQKFCGEIYSFFSLFLNTYSENVIYLLSSEIFTNLSEAPKFFIGSVFSLFKRGVKFLHMNKKEIPILFPLIKIIHDIFIKKVPKNDMFIFSNCLSKITKIIFLLVDLSPTKKSFLANTIKEKIFSNCDVAKLIKSYKEYLIEIATDFKKDDTAYKTNRNFYKEEVYKKYFKNAKPKSMYKIFLYYIKILNALYDGNASLSEIEFIQNSISSTEIIAITSILTLNIELRIELVKLFRLTYIDTLIDGNKLNLYRTEFQNSIEDKMKENLFSTQQNKIFTFYDMLMNVNASKITDDEYNFLLFEVTNFKSIINYSGVDVTSTLFSQYFEDSLVLSLVIYFNKVFAIVSSYKGNDLLKIYQLTYYILEMIKVYNEIGSTHFDLSAMKSSKRSKRGSISKALTKFNENDAIEKDIEMLTTKTFSPMNYYAIYQVLVRHLIVLFNNPKNKSNNQNASEFEIEDKLDIDELKEELIEGGCDLNGKNSYLNEIFDIYVGYYEGKYDFESGAFKAILDLNYGGEESTFRTVLCKYLLLIMTDEIENFARESTIILVNLLMFQTSATQHSLIELNEDPRSYHTMKVIIEKCFMNILSTVLSQFNPSLVKFNDDYFFSCAFIKLFKFLCEEHNQHFQKFFLKKFFFSLNDIQKISFYDMMLYVLEKIISLSCWEQVKTSEDFHHYFVLLFSCIIELLIEIIQGTEDSNFLSLINQKFDGNQRLMINANRMDPVLKKGKAFDSFLKCVKNLIISDDQNSEELDTIRKLLMDFFLAFMEEYRCPMEIKYMIIINFHASSIIKSISTVLKKIYKKMLDDNEVQEQDVKQKAKSESQENKLRRRRTMILLDTQNVKKKSQVSNIIQSKNKKIYFNLAACKLFKHLYFTDESFSSSSSFQLCCTMYHYFKLTLMQCKDSETVSFWNKIHNIKKEDLEYFNSSTTANTFTSDESDYEAFYVFKLFEKISKKVLVKVREDKPPIYIIYTKPPCLNYLSEQTKINFLANVNRSSRNTKLIELMEQTEYFKIEAEYNFKKLRDKPFIKKISWMNYYWFSVFIFIVDMALNIYMLAVDSESGMSFDTHESEHYTIIRVISLFFCSIVLLAIIMWLFTKITVYYKIEKAKYLTEHHIDEASHLSYYDKAIITTRSFFNKGELTSLLFFFVFRIIGSIKSTLTFTYSFSLVAVMCLSETLNSLSLSLFLKGRQLLWVTVFTFVVLYVCSGWGFYYLRDLFYDTLNRQIPENMCESLIYCFLTNINNGFRWYPGVGKVLRIDSAILHVKDYIHNYVFHFLFYLIIRVMMLKIVFGIILDSFKELREIKSNIQKDWKFKCFICNIEKDECEKRNQDFHEHCQKLHNIWDYANYMIMLRMTDFQDLNGVNSMCKEMILERQMQWIPDCEKDGDGNV